MSQFNRDQHHRQSIRLRGWDYRTPGAYFITICTYQRQNLFEDQGLRDLAKEVWRNIPTHPHAKHVELDEWVLMPNHLHGILMLSENEVGDEAETNDLGRQVVSNRGEAGRRTSFFAKELSIRAASPLRPGSIGAIVGNFKSLVTRRANRIRRTPGGKLWQRGYYDRIIRNERELTAIREYIWDNPRRWQEDRENLDALLNKMRLVLND